MDEVLFELTTQGVTMPMFLYAFFEPIHDNLPIQVMIVAVAMLIILDFVSGMLGAIVNKNWDSAKIREGLAHKCAEFGFMIVGDIIDALLFVGVELPFDIPNGCALGFICLSIILMELSSIMENAVRIDSDLGKLKIFQILANANIVKIEQPKEDDDEPEGAHAAER